uniref:Uncharacterized protein n=1 Tax=Pyramimonas obovata TaxID=1411642 RepID=A0A7S0RAF7_9CHLO|mmetsp:Transcript_29548/g.64511  ORF Transcript_29548/g.64511 Transcript_29548/m.64511 type:complete len:217 (+) Transcript_29548:49-699(+)|eukprot:CAMPEP_0118932214 /NCGR_PEP_ID=MMETSP1169-20130426/9493_1 /TAXON_ID=36882 /ORGANISM="Pyramimonas obovata, Strain CCMP722" /LENGTH=216 /DNA_ID=CAMNT_0006874837 /DNA_START=49 /DNA_END=699 /DNA_ORIENTATION=-
MSFTLKTASASVASRSRATQAFNRHAPRARTHVTSTRTVCEAREQEKLHLKPDWRVMGLVGALAMSNVQVEPVQAFGAEIPLSDVTYEIVECKPGTFLPSKGKFLCAEFTATATNKTKRPVEAADVFGFINDKNGNSAAAVNITGTSRTVLAPIASPIASGTSQVKFDVVVSKEGVDLGPLTLKGFKATVSNKDVEQRFKGFDECELDPAECELGL